MANPFQTPGGNSNEYKAESVPSPQNLAEIPVLLSTVNRSLDKLWDLVCKLQESINPVLDQNDKVTRDTVSPSSSPSSSIVGGELKGINSKVEALSDKVSLLTERVLL